MTQTAPSAERTRMDYPRLNSMHLFPPRRQDYRRAREVLLQGQDVPPGLDRLALRRGGQALLVDPAGRQAEPILTLG